MVFRAFASFESVLAFLSSLQSVLAFRVSIVEYRWACVLLALSMVVEIDLLLQYILEMYSFTVVLVTLSE